MSALPLPSLIEVRAELSRRRLHSFLQHVAWPVLQPGVPFQDNWHLHAICEHLEAVTSGQIKRLIINMPFRLLKSTLVSQAWPAWEWIERPHLQYLTSSYSKDVATRDAVDARRIIESPTYRLAWGDRFRIVSDQNAKTRYENDHHGMRVVTSTDSAGTGFGGNRITIDDPVSARDATSLIKLQAAIDWWRGTAATRLNDAQADAIIIVHQRMASNDLTGYVLESEDPATWEQLILPMRFDPERRFTTVLGFNDPRTQAGELLFPERLPESVVREMENRLGPRHTASQLNQNPRAGEGKLFKKKLTIIDELPDQGRGITWVRGWDQGASLDGTWTAGVKLGRLVDGRYVIAHVARDRLETDDRDRLIRETANLDGVLTTIDLPQDPGQAGKSLVTYQVRMLAGYTVEFSTESGNKITRASGFASQVNAGNVLMLRGPWNQAYQDELDSCPDGDMDQIDATSRAFARLVDESDDDLTVWAKVAGDAR